MTIHQRIALLAVVLAGITLSAIYVLAACPARGGPSFPPPLAPAAPACTDLRSPCPPWAG